MTKLSNKVIYINNRRTSMRLCEKEWKILDNICKHENTSRNKLIEHIEQNKVDGLGLTYLTRLFMVTYLYKNTAPLSNLKYNSREIVDFLKRK